MAAALIWTFIGFTNKYKDLIWANYFKFTNFLYAFCFVYYLGFMIASNVLIFRDAGRLCSNTDQQYT